MLVTAKETVQILTKIQHGTTVVQLIKKLNRNYHEKRLTGVVFLDVTEAFDTIWIEGLLTS